MRRRDLLLASGALLAAPLAPAQTPTTASSKLPIVGVLTPHPRPAPEQRRQSPFLARLRQLGWVDGETFELDRPDAGGREDRLPAMAAELAAKRVSVIWALGPEAAVAAARATKTIPIVFWGVPFPVEQGLVDSLARPGRNATGIAFLASTGVSAKALEYLKAIVPAARRLALIVTPSAFVTVQGETVVTVSSATVAAAQQMDFELSVHEVSRVEDFDSTFAAVLKSGAQAIFVPGTTLTFRERKRFVDFANGNRMPSVFNQREFVESGGLFSYGIDSGATIMQTLNYVDRILRGARPADLPVELPSKYELALNRRTEKALSLSFPQDLLLRADRVIE